MKTDLYTKLVLTALTLGVFALVFQRADFDLSPVSTVEAKGKQVAHKAKVINGKIYRLVGYYTGKENSGRLIGVEQNKTGLNDTIVDKILSDDVNPKIKNAIAGLRTRIKKLKSELEAQKKIVESKPRNKRIERYKAAIKKAEGTLQKYLKEHKAVFDGKSMLYATLSDCQKGARYHTGADQHEAYANGQPYTGFKRYACIGVQPTSSF